MTTFLFSVFYSFGLVIFVLGLQSLIFFPLTLFYEFRKKRALEKLPTFSGKVSVVVPAYNEENTIRSALLSVLDSDYANLEVIVVNDGSTDQTEQRISDLINSERIIYLSQANVGKANALNHGIAKASGEVILYTDADSLFLPQTVSLMVRWFADPHIDAVCGNDMPLHPQTAIHRFLTVTTHIGTGFVRRALSVIGCLQIISGNLGAIRMSVVKEIGGFKETWGEDLEITFRLHQHRKKIIFDPEPKVLAECPGTLKVLWRQRIRWVRSYIKVVMQHRKLFFSPHHWPFSYYLPINFFNMGVVPLLQMLLMLAFPFIYSSGVIQFSSAFDVLIYLGLFTFVLIAVYSILLDRSYADLKQLPYGLLIVPISYFYNLVVIYSWWKEIRHAEETWHHAKRREVRPVQAKMLNRWRVAFTSFLFVAIASVTTFSVINQAHNDTLLMQEAEPEQPMQFHLGLSTHFDAWPNWRDAINKIVERPMINKAKIIGVGAGRPEWVYFRWKDNESSWSSQQKAEAQDLLQVATNTFHALGARVAVMVDLFSPNYIIKNPQTAAVGFDGVHSRNQVSLIELAEGEYGKHSLAMIDYLVNHYPVDIINLTEITYYSFSFTSKELASFIAFSGKNNWPRDANGKINRDDPDIWAWKNKMMENYIRQVADIVHRQGKFLYVDVPVSWNDFAMDGRQAGLDYKRVLKHADKIVIWNYYHLKGNAPEVSRSLSKYMRENFPSSAYYISIGLWGHDNPASATSLGEAIDVTLDGGSKQIWITPNDMLNDAHWNQVVRHWVR